MKTNELINLIPPLSILISVMIILVLVIVKFGDKIFDKGYKAGNTLLLVTCFLFLTLLIVHLFKEQDWTPDTLKILIGVLVGTGSIKLAKKVHSSGSSVDINGNVGGDVAGRDINKNIQNIQEAISEIKDSVVHQNNQFVKETNDTDYLIHTIYERGEEIKTAITTVITHWQDQGWILKHFSSDYNGMDGIFLIFSKPKIGLKSEILYHRGINF
ncbi:hypothetical protein D3C87_142860 [compost metagenome]